MRTLSLRQLSPPALCALAALLGGSVAGTATVHGLSRNAYGPADAPALISDNGSFGGWRSDDELARQNGDGGYRTIADGPEAVSADCQQCSERDLGYRWAALAAVKLPDQCPSDSWGFRRGCLDYVGGV